MGWKTINGHRYYYRSERVGGRVVTRYMGKGDAARVFASVDAFLRQERNATRDAERADDAEVDELDARLDDLVARARRDADAVIEAAGYHRHKRQWRRRRERRPTADR